MIGFKRYCGPSYSPCGRSRGKVHGLRPRIEQVETRTLRAALSSAMVDLAAASGLSPVGVAADVQSTEIPAPGATIGGHSFDRSAIAAPSSVLVADLNGDGTPDLLSADAAGGLLYHQGVTGHSGTFDPPVTIDLRSPPTAILSGLRSTFSRVVSRPSRGIPAFPGTKGTGIEIPRTIPVAHPGPDIEALLALGRGEEEDFALLGDPTELELIGGGGQPMGTRPYLVIRNSGGDLQPSAPETEGVDPEGLISEDLLSPEETIPDSGEHPAPPCPPGQLVVLQESSLPMVMTALPISISGPGEGSGAGLSPTEEGDRAAPSPSMLEPWERLLMGLDLALEDLDREVADSGGDLTGRRNRAGRPDPESIDRLDPLRPIKADPGRTASDREEGDTGERDGQASRSAPAAASPAMATLAVGVWIVRRRLHRRVRQEGL